MPFLLIFLLLVFISALVFILLFFALFLFFVPLLLFMLSLFLLLLKFEFTLELHKISGREFSDSYNIVNEKTISSK